MWISLNYLPQPKSLQSYEKLNWSKNATASTTISLSTVHTYAFLCPFFNASARWKMIRVGFIIIAWTKKRSVECLGSNYILFQCWQSEYCLIGFRQVFSCKNWKVQIYSLHFWDTFAHLSLVLVYQHLDSV